MHTVHKRFWALSLGLLAVTCLPLVAGDRGQSPNGDKPKPDKPEKAAPAAVGPRYEGLVKSISADAVTLGSVSAKAARALGEGNGDVTLGLSGETRYAQLQGGRREELTAGRLVALALTNTEAGIVARGVVVYTGAAGDGQAVCDASIVPLVAATSSMSGSAEGRAAGFLRLGGDQPGQPAKDQAPRIKGLTATIDSANGDQLVVSVGGNKLALNMAGAALGKAEPRTREQVLVGNRVVVQCPPKSGDSAARSALALVVLPTG